MLPKCSPVTYIVGENSTLTNQSLLIKDVDRDSSTQSLQYDLTVPSRYGRLLRYGQPTHIFTQFDVDNNAIVYQHTPGRPLARVGLSVVLPVISKSCFNILCEKNVCFKKVRG